MSFLSYRFNSEKRRVADDHTILDMRQAAFANGYAIAVHGSRGPKDLDLIACPWSESVIPHDDLVQRLARASKLLIHTRPAGQAEKPHGRKAYLLIRESDGRIIDLSVMPVGSP